MVDLNKAVAKVATKYNIPIAQIWKILQEEEGEKND